MITGKNMSEARVIALNNSRTAISRDHRQDQWRGAPKLAVRRAARAQERELAALGVSCSLNVQFGGRFTYRSSPRDCVQKFRTPT